MKRRLAACAVAASTLAGVVLSGATAAYAAVSVRFTPVGTYNGLIISVDRASDLDFMGEAEWLQDPAGSQKGDSLRVVDLLADGYGLEAHLTTSPQRIATTRGHASPYADEVSGDLPEDTKYYMWVCVVKGTYSNCSNSYAVYS